MANLKSSLKKQIKGSIKLRIMSTYIMKGQNTSLPICLRDHKIKGGICKVTIFSLKYTLGYLYTNTCPSGTLLYP